jgi:hypothetical protein
MNPKNFLPRAPPGSCFVFRPNGPGTTDYISLQGTCGYLPMYVASFNGVNTQMQYVSTPIFNFGYNNFTIAFYFFLDPATLNNNPMIWGSYSCPGRTVFNYFVAFTAYGRGILFASRSSDTGEYFSIGYDTGKSQTGKWIHVTVVRKGTTWELYWNGNKVTNSTDTRSGREECFGHNIGVEWGWGNSNKTIRSIANVQFYNTALTPQEIQYLYQQGLGGGPVRLQNLVGWWPLNGDAKDYSGNNNHGTIYGGVTFVQNYNPP